MLFRGGFAFTAAIDCVLLVTWEVVLALAPFVLQTKWYSPGDDIETLLRQVVRDLGHVPVVPNPN